MTIRDMYDLMLAHNDYVPSSTVLDTWGTVKETENELVVTKAGLFGADLTSFQ